MSVYVIVLERASNMCVSGFDVTICRKVYGASTKSLCNLNLPHSHFWHYSLVTKDHPVHTHTHTGNHEPCTLLHTTVGFWWFDFDCYAFFLNWAKLYWQIKMLVSLNKRLDSRWHWARVLNAFLDYRSNGTTCGRTVKISKYAKRVFGSSWADVEVVHSSS